MKKVAVLTDSVKQCFESATKSGGGYVVAKNLIKELSKMPDVELTIFTGNGGYFEISGAKVVEIQKSIWDKSFYDEADKLIAEGNFDVVLRVNLPQSAWNSLLQCHSFESVRSHYLQDVLPDTFYHFQSSSIRDYLYFP